VFKDGVIVSFNFLLDLQGVNALREAFNLLSGDTIDEAGLADTVSTDETVLLAHGESEGSVLKEMVSTDDDGQGQVDVLVEVVALLVADFG
jgi:hypothetical protein